MYDIFSVTSRYKIKLSIIIMEISGKIIVALEPRSGQSARTGNNWVYSMLLKVLVCLMQWLVLLFLL